MSTTHIKVSLEYGINGVILFLIENAPHVPRLSFQLEKQWDVNIGQFQIFQMLN